MANTRTGTAIIPIPKMHSCGLPIGDSGPTMLFKVKSLFKDLNQVFSFSMTNKERETLSDMIREEYNMRHFGSN